MKDSKVFKGRVLYVTYMDTSKTGNPRYLLTIQDDSGKVTSLYTQVNSSLGYAATNFCGKDVTCTSRYIYKKLCIESIELVK